MKPLEECHLKIKFRSALIRCRAAMESGNGWVSKLFLNIHIPDEPCFHLTLT